MLAEDNAVNDALPAGKQRGIEDLLKARGLAARQALRTEGAAVGRIRVDKFNAAGHHHDASRVVLRGAFAWQA